MGFRVVDISYFAVETDLPLSIRNTHPSGILHAFRCTDTSTSTINNSRAVTGNNNNNDDDGNNDDDNNINSDEYIDNNDVTDNLILRRQEHTFTWIENSLHIEVALSHLEQPQHGFDRQWGIVFVPYSTKRNWIDRYPHAEPTLECLMDGTLVANVTNDVTKLNNNVCDGENGDGGTASASCTNDETLENYNPNHTNEGTTATATATAAENATSTTTPKTRKKEKKKRYKHKDSLLRSKLYIRDPERDELHVAIYNYLSWLHVKLSDVLAIQMAELNEYEKQKQKEVATMAASSCVDSDTNEDDDEEEDEDSHDGKRRNTGTETKTKKAPRLRKPTLCTSKGVNLVELQGALDKLESTFAILPNVKEEAQEEAAAAAAADLLQKQQEEQEKEDFVGEEVRLGVVMVPYEGEGLGEDKDDDESHRGHSREHQQSTVQLSQHDKESGEEDPQPSWPQSPQKQQRKQPQNGERPPFLEEALSTSLSQLVAARNLAGKGRRSRKRKFRSLTSIRGGNRGHSRKVQDFDEYIQRLVRYKEEHGDCLVPTYYKEDPKLGNWVRVIRGKKSALQKEGKEFEEIPPNGKILAKTLTAERLAKLDNVGFAWKVAKPRLPWEERFRDCMDYYEREGRWPPQSAGLLGEWVHKQRMYYAQRDVNFMKYKARQLDVVGFEWTPRGYTRVTWDEGFQMLMDYGRTNGHYDVQPPATGKADTKSDEFRLYTWVESLHSMYRSYKLGRMSGSLTEERILLLVKHGFAFRNDRVPLDLV